MDADYFILRQYGSNSPRELDPTTLIGTEGITAPEGRQLHVEQP